MRYHYCIKVFGFNKAYKNKMLSLKITTRFQLTEFYYQNYTKFVYCPIFISSCLIEILSNRNILKVS